MNKTLLFFLLFTPTLAFSQYNMECELQGYFLDQAKKDSVVTFEVTFEEKNIVEAQEFSLGMRIMLFSSLLDDNKLMFQLNVLDPEVFKAPLADFMNVYKLSPTHDNEIFFQTELNELNYRLSLSCTTSSPWSGI